MLDKNIADIKESFYSDIKSVSSIKDVEELRIKYFSRNGLVSQLFEDLKDVVKEEKPILGKKLNLGMKFQVTLKKLKKELLQLAQVKKIKSILLYPEKNLLLEVNIFLLKHWMK